MYGISDSITGSWRWVVLKSAPSELAVCGLFDQRQASCVGVELGDSGLVVFGRMRADPDVVMLLRCGFLSQP